MICGQRGRLKRIIIRYDGLKVSPFEIEKTIRSVEGVNDCCVVGGFDETHGNGQIPIAYVVADKSIPQKNLENIIKQKCDNELTEKSKVERIEFIDRLPLTPNGKVNFRKLEGMGNSISQ